MVALLARVAEVICAVALAVVAIGGLFWLALFIYFYDWKRSLQEWWE